MSLTIVTHSPALQVAQPLPSFKSLLRCHLCRDAFQNHLLKICSLLIPTTPYSHLPPLMIFFPMASLTFQYTASSTYVFYLRSLSLSECQLHEDRNFCCVFSLLHPSTWNSAWTTVHIRCMSAGWMDRRTVSALLHFSAVHLSPSYECQLLPGGTLSDSFLYPSNSPRACLLVSPRETFVE